MAKLRVVGITKAQYRVLNTSQAARRMAPAPAMDDRLSIMQMKHASVIQLVLVKVRSGLRGGLGIGLGPLQSLHANVVSHNTRTDRPPSGCDEGRCTPSQLSRG